MSTQSLWLQRGHPVYNGAQNAIQRLARHNITVRLEDVETPLRDAVGLLQERRLMERPPSAVELFVEDVVVASGLRHLNHEPTLTRVEIDMYLATSVWFFNSLWHVKR